VNIFKEAAKFIGWLSGALAGIAALLTVFGYLITTANLHLLGMDPLVINYDTEFYIRRGGSFFFYVTNLIVERILLHLLVIVILAAATGFLVHRLLRKIGLLQRAQSYLTNLGNGKLTSPVSRGIIIYAILIVLFAYQLYERLDLFTTPLNVSNLLYETNRTASSQTEALVRESIMQGQTLRLKLHFFDVLISVILSAALLFIAWKATSGFKFWPLLVAPFALIFLIYLLLLPMVYGVLIIPSEYSPVKVSSGNKVLSDQSENLYLITKVRDEFILWNATRKKLLWVPRNEIRAAEIGQKESILGK